jgi:hypothetical protein
MTPLTVKDWSSAGRDVLALGFTPIIWATSVAMICLIAYGPFTASTEASRVNGLVAIAVLYSALTGLGGMWFQRTRLEKLKFSGPGGTGGEIETGEEKP